MKLIKILFIISIIFTFTGCESTSGYRGEKKDGLPHGTGVWEYPNSTIYEGEFYEGLRSGEGVWINPEGITYSGSWSEDLYHGFGTLTIPDTLVYEGYWNKGLREGLGIQTYNDGRRYEGSWSCDQKHGEGKMHYPDGSYYTGEWADGKREGTGILSQADGEILSGQWEDDQFIYIPVDRINLSADRLVLQENTPSYSLEFEILPRNASEPALTWESSDPEVAEVIEGEIFPRNQGETMITVWAAADGIKSECAVEIIEAVITVRLIEFESNFLELRVDGEPVALDAAVIPDNATNQNLIWISSNPAVASVNQNGLVTPQTAGEAVITAQSADGSGASGQCTVTVRSGFPSAF